ncbi:MAG: SDR family oxidoreductase [Pyrinomonadaceae bacterium]|nr:SDR family oxidoreductase [Pyrinomonadaceae bacterium]
MKLKKLKKQVLVITGASSGIGLVTARMAAERGARLVLAARNKDALHKLADEIAQKGGECVYVVADVGNEEDVRQIARAAQEAFGGFDTWVNNAGVSVYGRMADVSTEDHRRLFETNFWGVVYGSLEAARHLHRRDGKYGGAIINIGSTLSDRAIPIQGMYSASKHAVKGFTDALRMELEERSASISVTLVKPGAINTPYPQHAKNYMEQEPSLPPPIYAPETVAETILHCAEKPERDVFVGGGGKFISALGNYAPRVADKIMATSIFNSQQKSGKPARRRQDALHAPTFGLKERGEYQGYVSESSVYTQASLHPVVAGALLLSTGLLIASLWRTTSKEDETMRFARNESGMKQLDEPAIRVSDEKSATATRSV